MAETVQDVVSDAEIERVHGRADFGSMTKRAVVNEGVLKYSMGYEGGWTQLHILQEHSLVAKFRGTYKSKLTKKKGTRYLRAMLGRHFRRLMELADD